MMTRISIIIPFYNEEENIKDLVFNLNKFCNANEFTEFEIIFVNDGSTDHSVEALLGIKQFHFAGKVINLSRNFGSHSALRAGIKEATGDYITFLYADLQDPPELIDKMCLEMQNGYEIVWAHRFSSNIGFFEKSFSKTYSILMRKFAIPSYPEKGFDVVMFSSKVKKQLDSNIESNSSIFLQILNFGFNQSFIEYNRLQRLRGNSKWTISKKIKLLIDSFVSFSYFPIRLVSVTGLLLFIIGLIWTLYILFRKICFNDLAAGWPMLMSILVLGFGVTNIALDIIAEYLWRTLDSSRKRPVFIIDNIISLTKRD